jgi:hypothetical protein
VSVIDVSLQKALSLLRGARVDSLQKARLPRCERQTPNAEILSHPPDFQSAVAGGMLTGQIEIE